MLTQPATTKTRRGANNQSKFSTSDEECVRKLGALLELRDRKNLAEVASLIGRLAVSVE